MSGTRFDINGFIPDPMPQQLIDRLPEVRAGIMWLMSFAATINEGQPFEEVPKAKYHICHHDEGLPCEPEQDI